jgi:DNA modification methylase
MHCGDAQEVLKSPEIAKLKGKVQLVFTSPPFPLRRSKAYGNLNGDNYIEWLMAFAKPLRSLLRPTGSLVIEIGNAWETGKPVMSTLPLRSLLAFKEAGNYELCQEVICDNPARLPGPAQWVTVERIRLKDSFTRFWWLSKHARPKADNRRVLRQYSKSMLRLLAGRSSSGGLRPSEHRVRDDSQFADHGGSISSNVLTLPNTVSNDPYLMKCRSKGLAVHPARMHPDAANFFISLLTEPGDIVLDPFAGSNLTGSCAEKLGRRWVAIEADRDYVRGSRERFEGLTRRKRR